MATPQTDPRAYYDLGHQGDFDATQLAQLARLSPAERLARHQRWRQWLTRSDMDVNFIKDVCDRLTQHQVEFLVVAGGCMVLHGSPRVTQDLDLCYRRTPENIKRLVAALAPLNPRPRRFPEGLPFQFDERTILLGGNFT